MRGLPVAGLVVEHHRPPGTGQVGHREQVVVGGTGPAVQRDQRGGPSPEPARRSPTTRYQVSCPSNGAYPSVAGGVMIAGYPRAPGAGRLRKALLLVIKEISLCGWNEIWTRLNRCDHAARRSNDAFSCACGALLPPRSRHAPVFPGGPQARRRWPRLPSPWPGAAAPARRQVPAARGARRTRAGPSPSWPTRPSASRTRRRTTRSRNGSCSSTRTTAWWASPTWAASRAPRSCLTSRPPFRCRPTAGRPTSSTSAAGSSSPTARRSSRATS